MRKKIMFVLFISIFGVMASHAQEMKKVEDFKQDQPKYNKEYFKETSQRYWGKKLEISKNLYEIVGQSKDTIRLDSLDINDIGINIPQFSLTNPKDDDYTILLNLIEVIFNENSQTAFFDLGDRTSAFLFSVSNTNKNPPNNDRDIQIVGHSQNFLQDFSYKLFKDYLDQNANVLVFTINRLNKNEKNSLELWGIKDSRLLLLSFVKDKIEEQDGEKYYQENYIIEGVDRIQAICN